MQINTELTANYIPVSTWFDGTEMTDIKCDGVVYIKLETQYLKLVYDAFNIAFFGAKGDGITNDTLAFQKVSNIINLFGGGVLRLEANKTYLIGEQEFAGENGKGFSYKSSDIIAFRNCPFPIILEGNGSMLKFVDGLKFGSFDPETGNKYTPVMPFTDFNYAADIGNAVSASNCHNIKIVDLIINGNDVNQIVGGEWGDVGIQRIHYGVSLYNIEQIEIANLETNHCLTDGIVIGYIGMNESTPMKPVKISNLHSHHNARQGLSIVGGRGIYIENSKFTDTGKSIITTPPGAGVDLEAEGSIIRDIYFVNCIFANNSGVGMVADSGDTSDVKFDKCNFYGTTSTSIWVSKPRFVFEDCLFSGMAYPALLDATLENDRPLYSRCKFEPVPYVNNVVYGTYLIDSNYGAVFDNCVFDTAKNNNIRLGSSVAQNRFIDCSFTQEGSSDISYIRGHFFGKNIMSIKTGVNDIYGSSNYGDLTYTGSVLSAASVNNKVMAMESPPYRIMRAFGHSVLDYALPHISMWYEPLGTGGYVYKGSITFNTRYDFTVGSPLGWICVEGGSPGTWTPFGIVGGVQSSAVPAITSAEAADLSTALTLINELKAKLNSVILALKDAKLMSNS